MGLGLLCVIHLDVLPNQHALGKLEGLDGHIQADGYHVRKGDPEGENLLDDVFLQVIPVLLRRPGLRVLQQIVVGPIIVQPRRNDYYGQLQDEDLDQHPIHLLHHIANLVWRGLRVAEYLGVNPGIDG